MQVPNAYNGTSMGSTSARTTQQSQFNPFPKKWHLPPHVEDVLHAKPRMQLRHLDNPGQGLYLPKDLLPSLDCKEKPLPWDKTGGDSERSSRSGSPVDTVASRGRFYSERTKKNVQPPTTSVSTSKHKKQILALINGSPYGKITFTNTNEPMHPAAGWVTHRLQHSCRSARFSLPSDYTALEKLTPLDYLEKYVVLTPEQHRRYDLVFKNFMDKQEKCLFFELLYPALNSMFANSLGEDNFHTLCTALNIGQDFKITSKNLFAGICTLTERLFWSSYLEYHYNTFLIMAENRSLLECADFCGLKWKLRDLNLSLDMKLLLFSLA